MGQYSKRLQARAAPQGEQLEGVQVTVDLRLVIHHGARVIQYQLTPEDAIGLGQHLVKRGTEAQATVSRPITARMPPRSTAAGYPVVLCTDARVVFECGVRALDFSPGCVELPPGGELPLFLEHDGRRVIGIVRDLRNCSDRMEGLAYFAATAFAQQIRKDVDAGRLACVSQGYTVLAHEAHEWGWQVTRWRPHELSVCRVGGDRGATIRPPAVARA